MLNFAAAPHSHAQQGQGDGRVMQGSLSMWPCCKTRCQRYACVLWCCGYAELCSLSAGSRKHFRVLLMIRSVTQLLRYLTINCVMQVLSYDTTAYMRVGGGMAYSALWRAATAVGLSWKVNRIVPAYQHRKNAVH